MLRTIQVDGPLEIVPATVASVAMTRRVLQSILARRPAGFVGVDARRMPVPPIKVGLDRDRPGPRPTAWCGCKRPWSFLSRGSNPTFPWKPVELRRFDVERHDGWLCLNVWIGQCRKCGRVYWG